MAVFRFFIISIILGIMIQPGTVGAQGTTAFQNLNFEAANLIGYSPRDLVPITSAMPGWSAFWGTMQSQTVGYDAINLSAGIISIIDSASPPFAPAPLQGKYSALLEGSSSTSGLYPATISQTGLVPAGIQSLAVDMFWESAPPVVTLGGQNITMVPIKTFPTYTLYAGNIAAFAGQSATLSFTAPAPTPVGSIQTFLVLDNIMFSTASVPEPGTLALFLIGTLFTGIFSPFRKK